MKKTVLLLACLALRLPAHGGDFSAAELRAAAADPAAYGRGRSYLVVRAVRAAAPPPPAAAAPPPGQVTPDRIVNTAKKAWPAVVKNYPVSDSRVDFANAVPEGVSSWEQLAGWAGTKEYLLTYVAENPYGMKTVVLSYKLVYTYGGAYNGRGRYLTGVSAELERVDAMPGYRLAAGASVADATVVNAGTHGEPLAALQFKMSYTISTAVSAWGGATVFYIDGGGAACELGGPEREKPAGPAGRQLEAAKLWQ